jgi:hypothetical protein
VGPTYGLTRWPLEAAWFCCRNASPAQPTSASDSATMSEIDNPLLRRKASPTIDPAKLKAAERAKASDAARAAKILSEVPGMNPAEVRSHLRLRGLNPLGDKVRACVLLLRACQSL